MPLRPLDPDSPDDVAALGHVHATTRRAAYAGLVPDDALDRVTAQSQTAVWRTRVAEAPDPSVLLVWEHDGFVAGFAFGITGPTRTTGLLQALHVLPVLHGSGAARALHDGVLAAFDTWGCDRAQLWVVSGNARAQAFYGKHGWVFDGTRGRNDVGGVDVGTERWTRPVHHPR